MTPFIRVAVIGLLLSACADQPPQSMMPVAPVAAARDAALPFQAAAPAGYCRSDDSDIAGSGLTRSITSGLGRGEVLLGVFRPCREPSPPNAGTPIDRLAIVAQKVPPSLVNEPAMRDRRLYLAMMADPRVWALIGERPLAAARNQAAFRLDSKQLDYLGADDYGAYSGIRVHGDFEVMPGLPPGGSAEVVFGTSLTGDHVLMVLGASVGPGRTEPHGRDAVRALTSELLRGTITAAE